MVGEEQKDALKYFYLKHARIGYGRGVHAPGMDAMVLGSLVEVPSEARRIVDLGSGTGILALMLAQKSHKDAKITGIEADGVAVEFCKQNFRESSCSYKLECVEGAVQDYRPGGAIDIVVCNPPYFENELELYANNSRGRARAASEMQMEQVLTQYAKYMRPETGRFWIVKPISLELGRSMDGLWQVERRMLIKSYADGEAVREIVVLKLKTETASQMGATKEEEFVVYERGASKCQKSYSPQYREVCGPWHGKTI